MPLHPFYVTLLETLAARGQPGLSAGTPVDARALVAAGRGALGPAPEMASVETIEIAGRSGPIAARLFKPSAAPDGLLVYLHGGGWVVGALDDFDGLARSIAARSNAAVLLPDYRLAPEHPFPAGLEDAEDAIVAALRDGPGWLGRTSLRVAVGGDSAGANLATVAVRALPEPDRIALQVLIYPVTDCDFERPSYRDHGTGLTLTARDMRWFFDHYTGAGAPDDPRISPLRNADLAGSPPAFVLTAGHDVLCDEGLAYADALEAAGVPVERRHAADMPHGFIRMFNHLDVARAAVEAAGDAIARAIGDRAPHAAASDPGPATRG